MKLPTGKFSLGKLSLGKFSLGKLSLGKPSLGKIAPGKLSLGALPLGKMARLAGGAKTTGTASGGGTRRIPMNKATLAIGSGVLIFTVGFVLQNFGNHPASTLNAHSNQGPASAAPTVQTPLQNGSLEAITPTSARTVPEDVPAPDLPQNKITAELPDMEVNPAEFEFAQLQDTETPQPLQALVTAGPGALIAAALSSDPEQPDTAQSAPKLPCDIAMMADPAPAATVDLMVEATCLPDARFTLHHNGMMFHALTDEDGWASLRVPALAKNAVFIASFDNGEGAVAQIEVPMLDFYDRVVAQWRGDTGLGLHALEYGANYFEKGHVHSDNPSDMNSAASGTSGFLTRFGMNAGADALRAEVYTFPTVTAQTPGSIGLSIETEVTAANCGKEIAAQTLQHTPNEPLRTQDLTLFVPDCDGNGDFLVLNNLFEDLKVAAN